MPRDGNVLARIARFSEGQPMRTRSFPNWQKLVVLVVILAAGYGLLRRRSPASNTSDASVVSADSAETPAWVAPMLHGPMLYGCPVFPANNVWNITINKLLKDANSDTYIQTMGPDKPIHPDFGANGGIPFEEVPPGTKRVKVDFDYRDQSDLGNYPIPPGAPIEGGGQSDGDRHVILVQPTLCMLFEVFAAYPQPDGTWKAGSGIKMDLTDNALRPDGYTSGDAAGLPILPGLVRYDEVASGVIKHALRFTVPQTQAAHVWPARHDASKLKGTNYPPMGIRLRLRADFDITPFSKSNQVILVALKRYGMILADNGSAFYISGAPDPRWDDDDLHHLNGLRGKDFEVVDESNLQMAADSGRVDPKSTH
jgi:hypothetical protein